MKLFICETGGEYRQALPLEILEAAKSSIGSVYRRGTPFNGVRGAKDYFQVHLGWKEHEIFGCAFLDNRHRLIAFEELFRGTIDGASVYPREVVKRVLHHNAAAVIFAHNHPSGIAEPSRADEAITGRLKSALALIDVRVLDHIIVSPEDTVSFGERGLL